jgi:hypothetical protein
MPLFLPSVNLTRQSVLGTDLATAGEFVLDITSLGNLVNGLVTPAAEDLGIRDLAKIELVLSTVLIPSRLLTVVLTRLVVASPTNLVAMPPACLVMFFVILMVIKVAY